MHNKKTLNKSLIFITIVLAMTAVIGVLSGCQNFGKNPQDIEKDEVKNYISQVNDAANSIKGSLNDFQNCAKEQDVNGMQEKLKNVQSAIDNFNKIQAPEKCKDLKQLYSDAFSQLTQSLNEMTLIYQDYKDNKIDVGTLTTRVQKCQENYNKGIETIKKADQEATKLTKN